MKNSMRKKQADYCDDVSEMVSAVVKHVKIKLVESDMSHQHTSSSLPLKRMATFWELKLREERRPC